MTNQLIIPSRALDRNGEPQAGALAYVYKTKTTTAVTATDAAGVALSWPVTADLDGVFPQMFYAGTQELRVIITTSAGVILPGGDIDPVAIVTPNNTASTIAFTPTATVPETNVQAAIASVADTLTTLTDAAISGGGLVTGSGSLPNDITLTVTAASNAEAVAGTAVDRAMTPAATKQAIAQFAFAGVFTSTQQTITSGGLLTIPHNLGRAPKLVVPTLVCQTAEAGWAIGDVLQADWNNTSTAANRANTVYWDSVNLYVRFSDQTACFVTGNKTTGVATGLTNANWKLVVGAF